MSKEQLIKIAKGAGIAMGAAALTALFQYCSGVDFGKYNELVQALVAIGLNIVKVSIKI
jgi:hypothetical protein